MALVSGYGRIVDVIEFLWGVNPKLNWWNLYNYSGDGVYLGEMV
jgi:hypothetical protein